MCFYDAELMPMWMSHVGQNTVLEDDVVFLHEQERHQVEAGGSRKTWLVGLCECHRARMQLYAGATCKSRTKKMRVCQRRHFVPANRPRVLYARFAQKTPVAQQLLAYVYADSLGELVDVL